MKSHSEYIGIILSNATTQEATCQLLEAAERGNIYEGTLLVVETDGTSILARVSQIVPYNAFYTEGDPFSEARRKDLPIPEQVARKYEICRLELLIQIPRKDIKYPPRPGDHVIKIDLQQNEKKIFGVSRGDPKYVWFGSLFGYADAPIPLKVENIPMHIAIFGITGSGKSFTTGSIIESLAEIPAGNNEFASYPMIIIDAHGDYKNYVGQNIGRVEWVRRYVFPRSYESPDMRSSPNVRTIGLDLNQLSSLQLAEIIMLFQKGTIEGAEQQVAYLDQLFEMISDNGYTQRNNLFISDFDHLLNSLDELARPDPNQPAIMHNSTKMAIRRALEHFMTIETRHHLLSASSDFQQVTSDSQGRMHVNLIDDLTTHGGIAIIDLSADGAPGVDLSTKQLLMTYLAALLFEQFSQYKIDNDERYLMFIIEEAQNFVPDRSYPISGSLARKILSDIATQGRKFGITLGLVSQRPSFVDRIVLSMCNTFFIHRVSPEDVSFVKGVTGGLQPSVASRLTTLDTGDLIVTGQMNNLPFPLLIHVPEQSRAIEPGLGQTNVVDNLIRLRRIHGGYSNQVADEVHDR